MAAATLRINLLENYSNTSEDGITVVILRSTGTDNEILRPASSIVLRGDFLIGASRFQTVNNIVEAWNRDYRAGTGIEATVFENNILLSVINQNDFTTTLSGLHAPPPNIEFSATVPGNPPFFAITDVTAEEASVNKCQNALYRITVINGTPPYRITAPIEKNAATEADLFFEFERDHDHDLMVRVIGSAIGDVATRRIPVVQNYDIASADVDTDPATGLSTVTINLSTTALTPGVFGYPVLPTYQLDNGNPIPINVFQNVPGGPHVVTVEDQFGCRRQIGVEGGFFITGDVVSTAVDNDPNTHIRHTISVAGGTAPYQITSPVVKTANTIADLFFEIARNFHPSTDEVRVEITEAGGSTASFALTQVNRIIGAQTEIIPMGNSSTVRVTAVQIINSIIPFLTQLTYRIDTNVSNNGTIENVSSGDHTVVIEDVYGGSFSTQIFVENFKPEIFNVIKAPPEKEPQVKRIFNRNVSSLPMIDKSFLICYRYIYDTGEASALSFYSRETFFPANTPDGIIEVEYDQEGFDLDIVTYPTNKRATYLNNAFNGARITIELGRVSDSTGGDISDIEVFAVEAGSDIFYRIRDINLSSLIEYNRTDYSDDFLRTDNLVFNSGDRTITFDFFNDETYTQLSQTEARKLFDNVPLRAVSQEIIDSVLIYGNYTDAYDNDIQIDAGVEIINVSESIFIYSQFQEVILPSENVNYDINTSRGRAINEGDVAILQVVYGTDANNFYREVVIEATTGYTNMALFINAERSQIESLGLTATLVTIDNVIQTRLSITSPGTNDRLRRVGLELNPDFYSKKSSDRSISPTAIGFDVDRLLFDKRLFKNIKNNDVVQMALNVRFSENEEDNRFITLTLDSSSNYDDIYEFISGDTDALQILNDKGFNINDVSDTSFSITINQSILRPSISGQSTRFVGTRYPESFVSEEDSYIRLSRFNKQMSLKPGELYSYALQYYDEYNRQGGLIELGNAESASIYDSNGDISRKAKITINHLAPTWAKKFKLLRKDKRFSFEQIVPSGVEVIQTSSSNIFLQNRRFANSSEIFIRIKDEDNVRISDNAKIIELISTARYSNRFNILNNTVGRRVYNWNTDIIFYADIKRIEVFTDPEGDENGTLPAGRYIVIDNPSGDGFSTSSAGKDGHTQSLGDGTGPNMNLYLFDQAVFNVYSRINNEVEFYREIPVTFMIDENRNHLLDSSTVDSDRNQSANQPFVKTLVDDGDIYYRQDKSFLWMTYQVSADSRFTRLGRPQAVSTNFRQTTRPYSVTYSQPYVSELFINGLSDFNTTLINFKDFDVDDGRISRIYSRDTDLVIFQERKVIAQPFNKTLLTLVSGQDQVSQSDRPLGVHRSYVGEYGMSHPESFAFRDRDLFFVDSRNGVVLRFSENGLYPISDHDMSDTFYDILMQNSDGKMRGFYDFFCDDYGIQIGDRTYFFDRRRSGWSHIQTFVPDVILNDGVDVYSFKSNNLWVHNKGVIANFYNNQANANIKFSANESYSDQKVLHAIYLEGSAWRADIETPEGSTTQIQPGWYENKEGFLYASVPMDSNTANVSFLGSKLMGRVVEVVDISTNKIMITLGRDISGPRVGDYVGSTENNLVGVISSVGDDRSIVVDVISGSVVVDVDYVFYTRHPELSGDPMRSYIFIMNLISNGNSSDTIFSLNTEIQPSLV